jgi:tetratricopeptide (TPR) repeat protein
MLVLLSAWPVALADEVDRRIQAAIEAHEQGEVEEAETTLEALTELHPRDRRPAWHLANLIRRDPLRFEEAIEVIEAFLQRSPGDRYAIELLFTISRDALRTGLPAVARYGAKILQSVDPGEKSHRLFWARAAYREGEKASVIRQCRDLMTDFPSYADAYHLLVRVLTDQGRFEEAVGVYQNLLRERSGDVKARLGMATILLWNLRDYDRAEMAYRAATDSAPAGSDESKEAEYWLKRVEEQRARSEALRDRRSTLRMFAAAMLLFWGAVAAGLYCLGRPSGWGEVERVGADGQK